MTPGCRRKAPGRARCPPAMSASCAAGPAGVHDRQSGALSQERALTPLPLLGRTWSTPSLDPVAISFFSMFSARVTPPSSSRATANARSTSSGSPLRTAAVVNKPRPFPTCPVRTENTSRHTPRPTRQPQHAHLLPPAVSPPARRSLPRLLSSCLGQEAARALLPETLRADDEPWSELPPKRVGQPCRGGPPGA